ncbi:vesicular glutamate transporter 3-like [Planococcus citri]|uniref:vesicular glutamate transporter 3-like n=1 Tax=Planococcus citri TaxID=170843 RepID=UPI0031F8EA20
MFFHLECIFSQKRYMIAFLAFFGYVNMFCLRANLSMAIVEMTSNKTVVLENGTLVRRPEFEWSSQDKGFALSAFSFGYIFTVVGGLMAAKYGGATVFGVGIALTALATFLTPYLVYLDFKWFIMSRIVEGIFEAIAFSSMSELWSKWSPPEERSRLVSYSFTGVYVGLTISYPISGFVAGIWGWPAIFYTTGGAALIWSVFWLTLVKNDPASDRRMSNAERLFLTERLKNIVKDSEISYPWCDILTSIPVWTLCIVEFVFSCGYTIIILYLPLYIKDISSIDINQIGILSALPHLCAVASHPIAGYLADYFRNKKILDATQTHKLYICAGFSIGALLLNVAAFWPNFAGIIISLSIFRLFTSFSDVAFHVNVIDLSPKYSSLLIGMGTSFFTLGAILSPLFIGLMVQHHSQEEWNFCFISFSIIYLFGAALYWVLGSGKLQSWDKSSASQCTNEAEQRNDTQMEER